MSPWIALSPMWLALAGAVFALAHDAFGRRCAALTSSATFLALAAVAGGWIAVSQDPTRVFSVLAAGRGFSGIGAVVFGLGAVSLVAGRSALLEARNGGQVAALVALAALAAAVLPASLDLLVTIVALEAVALTGYALVSSARKRRADEAAMKYFIQGAVATGFAFYAVSVLFGLFGGSLFLPDLGSSLAADGSRAALTAMALLLAAFAYKLGAFPFHSWAPDAYETAPPAVAAFLAGATKLAVLGAVVLVFPGFAFADGAFTSSAIALFAALALASIVFGNLAGLKQASFARMLAYSGIAQVGYAMTAFVALHAAGAGSGRSSTSVMVFGLAYALGAAGAFITSQAVRRALPGWDGTIAGLAGLGSVRPWLAAATSVCLLSLTGIPLTAGFWGKFLVFGDVVSAGYAWLAIVGVLGSVVSFGYYGAVVRAMYLEERPALLPVGVGAARAEDDGSFDRRAEAAVVGLAIAILALGLAPLFSDLAVLGKLLALPI